MLFYQDMLFDRHGDSCMAYGFMCFQEKKRVSDAFPTAALVNTVSE